MSFWFVPKALCLVLVCCWCPSALSAPDELTNSGRIGPPPSLPVVERPAPHLEPREFARRGWLISATFGFAQQVCPAWAQSCDGGPGWAWSASLWSRPTPWFSWGPLLSWSRTPERVQTSDLSYDGHTSERAASLAARLWASTRGAVDPYVQVASGVADAQRAGHASLGDAEVLLSDERIAPLYSVRVGADLHLTEHLRIGVSAGWTHRLDSWRQRCLDGGVCLAGGVSRFSLENGVWGLEASVSSSFGEAL